MRTLATLAAIALCAALLLVFLARFTPPAKGGAYGQGAAMLRGQL